MITLLYGVGVLAVLWWASRGLGAVFFAGIGIAAGLYFGGGNELPEPAGESSEPSAAGSTWR